MRLINTVLNTLRHHAKAEHYHLRLKLLQKLLRIFVPLAIFIIVVRRLLLPNDTTNTLILIFAGFVIIWIIYFLTRSPHYYRSLLVILTLAYSIILGNAYFSSPPHLEVAYLLVVPLLAAAMFSFVETIIVSLMSLVISVIFLFLIGDIGQDIIFDLLALMGVIHGFILFAAFQRNSLEKEQQELLIKEREVGILRQFLGNVSHDLKTPISIINTSVYLLEREKDPIKMQHRFQHLREQSKRLEKLVQDMLTMSRLDNASVLNSLQWVDLNEIIQQCVSSLNTLAERKSIVLEFHNLPLAKLLANQDNIYSMFLNVVENAISYTQEGGKVLIETSQSSQQMIIKIKDTGIGIDPAALPFIFDRFYRVDKARSNQSGGSGLGLAIVKRCVDMYGGTISVDSVVDKGTLFTIVFPMVETGKIGTKPSRMGL